MNNSQNMIKLTIIKTKKDYNAVIDKILEIKDIKEKELKAQFYKA